MDLSIVTVMKQLQAEVGLALRRSGGIVRMRDHPDLRRTIYTMADRGLLTRMHPGVFACARWAMDPDLRVRAAALWRHEAVITGRAAARLTFWRQLAVPVVDVATTTRLDPQPGIRHTRRAVPPEWTVRHRTVRLTRPALTVVDLMSELGGQAISEGLRCRIPMSELWRAVESVPGRRDQIARRDMLRSYRGEPWSEAERRAHLLFRSAGIAEWVSNWPLVVDGDERILDLVFERLKVAIEIDGYAFHATRPRFETDRLVASWLTANGWRVLRFTWTHLTERPEFVIATVKATLRCAEREKTASRRRNVG